MAKGEDDDLCADRPALLLPAVASASAPAVSGPRRWTPARIESELRAFADELGRFPTTPDFREAGRQDLRNAIHRAGGMDAWAQRTGYTRELPRKWSAYLVATTLAELKAQHGGTLTLADVRADNGLYMAMDKFGGRDSWVARFDIQPADSRWDDERIERELREYLAERAAAGLTAWPTQKEFKADGRKQLMYAIYAHGDMQTWAARVGHEARRKGLRVRPSLEWTDDRLRRELGEFLARRSQDGVFDWPSQREFREAGLGGLHAAIYNHGGAEKWAAEFGRTPRPPGRPLNS